VGETRNKKKVLDGKPHFENEGIRERVSSQVIRLHSRIEYGMTQKHVI